MGLAKSASHDVIASEQQFADLIRQIQAADRVALDTEADSLHSYREKLCLLQISVSASAERHHESVCDFIVDPLSNLDLEPLRQALEPREIVLHAADYDLRMLRRGLNFTASRIFDTVIAARLLGIREFSLGALVKRFFGVELHKHSQKANWATATAAAADAEIRGGRRALFVATCRKIRGRAGASSTPRLVSAIL